MSILRDEQIPEALTEQINAQLQDLSKYKPGTEEYKSCLEGINKLYRLAIEDETAEIEMSEKTMARDDKERQHIRETEEKARSRELQEKQLKKELIHKYVAAALTAGVGLIGIICNVILIKKGFKFEETGAFTSTTFKGLFQKLFRKN